MSRMHHSHLRVPFIVSLALLVLFTPLLSMPLAAQGAGQSCQALEAPGPDSSGLAGDVHTFPNEVILPNGAVIGYQDYWTGEISPGTGYFMADSGDGNFMAGDYPAGASLGAVWSELCSMLVMMGTLIDQGVDGGGGIYALMIVTENDGSQRHGLVRVVYGSGTDIPVFGSLFAPADTFYISLGEADGLGINGQRVFDELDLDHDAILATLAAGAPVGTGTTSTTPQDPAPVETPQAQDPGATGVAGEFTSVNGTVFAYSSAWTPDTSMEEAPDGIVLASGDAMLVVADLAQDLDPQVIFEENMGDFPNIIDQGPTPDGGYYALAWGQTNAGQWMHVIFRTMDAPGTSTPIIVIAITPEGSLDQALTLLQDVTANGVPVLDGMNADAAIATFDADGPTGTPVFAGGEPSAPVDQPTGDEEGAASGGASPRDILGELPGDRPDTLPDPTPEADDDPSGLEGIFR